MKSLVSNLNKKLYCIFVDVVFCSKTYCRLKFGKIVRFRLGLKLFPQFTKILLLRTYTENTFDVYIIMNALLTITNMVTSMIPSLKQYILIVSMFQTTVYTSKTHM